MNNKITLTTILIIVSLMTTHTMAKPIVIYDSGNAIDARPFYPFETPNNLNTQQLQYQASQYTAKSMQIFPVVTKNLTPGRVDKKIINVPQLHTTLCVIGDDELSKKWLQINRKMLTSKICYVVNVASKSKFDILQQLSVAELVPVVGDELITLFNLKHYPAMITNSAIYQ